MTRSKPWATSGGFTLVEVLIALAITAFVSTIAYTSLSTVIDGVERSRTTAQRTYDINRAWMLISRDLRQVVARPVRDEFGELEPAMMGGPAARFLLSFTRTGWHNTVGLPRSHLQRVNYRIEDDALWRDSYPVLDRAGDTEPQTARLLDGVIDLELGFLGNVARAGAAGNGLELDTRDWAENWIGDNSGTPGAELPLPAAVELRLQLEDWGEMRRLYVLPPL